MRLTKIYTKVGDKGTTLLADGSRVPKASPRIEAYGTVDELNSHTGLLRDFIRESLPREQGESLDQALARVQNELFDLGGELATPASVLNIERQQVVHSGSIGRLEQEIDAWNEKLPPLSNFVLPGGHKANSQCHVCRCVCRRAEREITKIAEDEKVRDTCRIYLNRLSDWFFVLSRAISVEMEIPEVLWQQRKT